VTALPEVNTLVRIALGDELPVLPSRVEDVAGTEVLVAAARYVGDLRGPQPSDIVSLHWTSARGVCSVPAEFVAVERSGIKVWRLRVLGEVTLVQRRRFARVETGGALSVSGGSAQDADLNTVRMGWMLDLSEGGVRCRVAPGAFSVDEPVEVRINLGGEVIVAVGSVLRASPRDRGFEELIVTFPEDHSAADRVRRHVYAEQLRQRRAALAGQPDGLTADES